MPGWSPWADGRTPLTDSRGGMVPLISGLVRQVLPLKLDTYNKTYVRVGFGFYKGCARGVVVTFPGHP